MVAPARLCVPLPDSVSDETGSLALVNPLTMLELTREVADAWGSDPKPYLQTAAGSSVGKLISAVAVRHGHPLVNLVRSAEGAALLSERFPSIPAFSTSDPDWQAKVREALNGAASVILDPIGGDLVAALLGLLGDGGVLVPYGALAGPVMPIPSLPIVRGQLRVHGVSVSRWVGGRSAEQQAKDVAFAVGLAAERPDLFEVDASYDLADFGAAIEHARRPGKVGTVLLISPVPAAGSEGGQP